MKLMCSLIFIYVGWVTNIAFNDPIMKLQFIVIKPHDVIIEMYNVTNNKIINLVAFMNIQI